MLVSLCSRFLWNAAGRCLLLCSAQPRIPCGFAQLQAPSGEIIQAIRQLGLEGVIGKRIDSIYESGERSGAWIKYRTNKAQEFVNLAAASSPELADLML